VNGLSRLLGLEFGDRRGRRAGACPVTERKHLDRIAHADVAGLSDYREQAFAWHDAIARLVVDGAFDVAHLADLADRPDQP
jgi:hypothetical protein